jgi:glucosamine--fructose-6-phosphate aminotransferase (isomerizing)
MARILSGYQSVFVLGRGLDFPVAMEAALKFKETAYMHAEAMYAGEFKHGPISLIEYGMPVICLLGDESIREKTLSNIEEVVARGAQAFMLDPHANKHESLDYLGEYLPLPELPEPFCILLQLVVVQLLAYHAGVTRNVDVDKPRNLAKSVTVE